MNEPSARGLASARTGGGFSLGMNYWPASSAMRMWRRFEPSEVERDFDRCGAAGCDAVRVFLLWEDFQPDPSTVDDRALERLRTVADLAGRSGLGLVPTLFTGHMSGVNWIPAWALGTRPAGRFRTIAGDAVVDRESRDWTADPVVGAAQALLAREAAAALAGHPALRLWDLGNENSNCVVPATREHGRRWLAAMAGAIRSADASTPITIGLHAEDLEEDRRIGPAEAAEVCDVLSMHGYPMYLRWAAGRDDEAVLPFLASITRWLGRKDVLFEEFGAATVDPTDPPPPDAAGMLLTEDAAGAYTGRALDAIHVVGCTGAYLWCYADYDRSLWTMAPLDHATHERHFGLWRADGSAKPAVGSLPGWSGRAVPERPDDGWIDIRREEYFARPLAHLARLYDAYRTRR
ncbi:MAG TPA: hypothetical protein VF998_11905 [Candidatus Limnocylindria bacterium]